MQIQQSFHVAFAPEQVWRCFHDIEGIVACLPGAALTAPPSGGAFLLTMTVKLGPIVANFAGQGEMTLDDAARSGSIAGGGSDRKSGSRIKGQASFSLHDATAAAASTRIDILLDYSIAGSLAQFSRGGLVRELADTMTAKFSDNLRKKLEADRDIAPTRAAAATPKRTAAATPAAPLDLGKMFWRVLLARLKRRIGLSAHEVDDARSRDD